jgi:serine/threonine protein kinase
MLMCDRQKILGEGGFATVFEGTWGGVKVAVKRILLGHAATTEQEEKALKMLDHVNVIKLFHVEEDQDFKYWQNETILKWHFKSLQINIFIECSSLNCVMLLWTSYFSKKMTRKNTVAQCRQKQKSYFNWLKDSRIYIKWN